METNSNAETDPLIPTTDAASGVPETAPEPPAETHTGAQSAAAAAEGVPEPLPELAIAQQASSGDEAPASPAAFNVTEESRGELPSESPSHEEEPAAEEAGVIEDTPATHGETAEAPSGEEDPLAALAAQSQRARLSAPDEERATTLLKDALQDGRAGVARAVNVLPQLPWVVGVSAVSAAWPEMKAAFRTQLLSGLGKLETDAGRRIRLSIARGLYKLDIPTALKLAISVAKEMRDKESGALTPKNAQIFANVFIGRAKPWIAQVPLAELKPADADLLVHCAVVSAFTVPHAPVTQLGVVKWVAESGRLAKLHELAQESAAKGVARWSAKWQGALRKEVTDLPEQFSSVLKAPAAAMAPAEKPATAEGAETGAAQAAETPEAGKEPAGAPENVEEEDEDEDEDDDTDEEAADREEEAEPTTASQPKPRPVYESKTVPRKPEQPQPQQQSQARGRGAQGTFDLRETLRQIESHVAGLRSELVTTQNKLRQREQELQKNRRPERSAAPIIAGEPTPDELARLNQQLELRNAELQQRIADLTQDSEDRAASMGAHGGEPLEHTDNQLRKLLSLKLQEDFEDFMALEKEKPDLVVQQHYRTVLRHVLEVLRQEGVTFQEPKSE